MKRAMRQNAPQNTGTQNSGTHTTTTQAVSYSYGNNAGALASSPAAPVPTSFAPVSINYAETRADGGFGWDVKYDLSFDGTAFTVQTRIHLTGDDAGSMKQVWEQGIEGIWSDKYSLSDGTGSYAIRFDVQFVNSGNQHYNVNVSNSYGRCDMLNWCTQTDWGPDYQDELAAHEFGHMIGAFDEYAGGATYGNFAAAGTIMSDLTPTLRPNYMNSIDYYAEQFTGRTLEIVEIPRNLTLTGNTWADSLYGGAGNDTLSGLSGNDQLFGGAGNDLLWGDAGNDTLRGQTGNDVLHGGSGADLLMGDEGNDTLWGDAGNDTLWGGAGADLFVFARGGGQDRIADFSGAQSDRIQIASNMTYRLGSDGSGSALLDFGGGDRLTLAGITPIQVTTSFFTYG